MRNVNVLSVTVAWVSAPMVAGFLAQAPFATTAVGPLLRGGNVGLYSSIDTLMSRCGPARPLRMGGTDGAVAGELRLFNTAGRSKQPLKVDKSSPLKFYSCGPTVYDSAHIGNFRAFLTYDLLKRWLLFKGYDVHHVCNLTDVDDKIIQRMRRDGVGLRELTDKYTGLFFDDLASLNIIPASRYPRATDHIEDIVAMIQGLIDKGIAYKMNGSVYFRVSKHKRYGSLANLDFEGMQDGRGEGGGISDLDEYENDKETVKDFALWKAYKPEDGDVAWETPLGRGRPGWHIECSAMAHKYLGETLDIHAGGVDLVFPHHENEIAQSEGFTGKPFCNCWVHNAFVNVDSEKMSKSKGNFLTLRGALATALDVRAFRFLVVSSHYRTTLNFSKEALAGARNTLKRLDKFRASLQQAAQGGGEGEEEYAKDAVARCLDQFAAGMDDDLNTPRAVAALFTLVKTGEKAVKSGNLSCGAAEVMLTGLDRLDTVLGAFYEPQGFDSLSGGAGEGGEAGARGRAGEVVEAGEIPEVLAVLLEKRLTAREAKDWATADVARDKIREMGYAVKDVKGGDPVVTRL